MRRDGAIEGDRKEEGDREGRERKKWQGERKYEWRMKRGRGKSRKKWEEECTGGMETGEGDIVKRDVVEKDIGESS